VSSADTPSPDSTPDAADGSAASASTAPARRRPILIAAAVLGALVVVGALVFAAASDGDDDAAAGTSTADDSGAPTTDAPEMPEATDPSSPSSPSSTLDEAASTPTSSATTIADEATGTTGAPSTAPSDTTGTTTDAGSGTPTTTPDDTVAPAPTDFRLLFQSTRVDEHYGFVAAMASDDGDERTPSELRCERLDARLERGLCARSNRGAETTFEAVVFDAEFNEGYRIGLAGPPSRVRLSPSGALGAVTSFVTGHAYENDGFSTQTILIDLVGERVIDDIENGFDVLRDGAVWSEIDFNFWGVTFVDDERFYATLSTGGSYYLVGGEVSSRTMRIVHDGGQCPSVSPDGTRLAYRTQLEAEGQPTVWRLAVLDLDTSDVVLLAETRGLDDQPFWLDDDRVAYGMANPDSPAAPDTWVVPADGTGEPELFVESAWSLVMQPIAS
jgi:hypothetical protein